MVTGDRVVNVTRVIDLIRAVGLVVVIITVSVARPRPGFEAPAAWPIAITLGLSAVAWIVWMLAADRPRTNLASLAVMGAAGGVLAGLSPNSPAVAIGCAACLQRGRPAQDRGVAGRHGRDRGRVPDRGPGSPGLRPERCWASLSPSPGLWSVSLTRREYLVRAQQAEHMLAETRRALQAETHAAALAERARIARDIHDVLAHSLAAVSVNLQAAEGLLAADSLPADNPELAKAVECIDRAGTLTREGLAAARRAILALRDDAAPLPDQLSSLAGQYRAVGDVAVDFTVTGEPRPLSEQASLVAYRTAQEALTNARKHAPGQPVTLTLGFEVGQITVAVANPLPPAGNQGPLATTGAGAGLQGLRERAALAGGTLEAGPADWTWRVCLKMPA